MTQNEDRDLLEILYKENLAEKVYLSDEEITSLQNFNPETIPNDIYFEEIKEGEEINKRFYKYALIENCDSLLKMKLLKKSRLQLIFTGIALAISIISLILLIILIAK